MIARISSALHARLLALADASPEAEICGLLLGPIPLPVRPELVEGRERRNDPRRASFDHAQDERVEIGDAIPAANVAADPATRFEIDPAALFAALRAERAGGPRLLGHYHSHPTGRPEPSACDAAMAHDPGRLWLIVADGRIGAWHAVPGGSIHAAFEPVTLEVAHEGCETGHRSPQGAA